MVILRFDNGDEERRALGWLADSLSRLGITAT